MPLGWQGVRDIRVSICILAGGKSRRFRKDKLFQPFRGKFLIDSVINSSSLSDDILVVGKLTPKFYHLKGRGIRFIPESCPESASVFGIEKGLRAARYERVLFIPGDTPLLKRGVVEVLLREVPPSAIYRGSLIPLPCLLSKVHILEVERLMREGKLAIRELHAEIGTKPVPFKLLEHIDYGGSSLKNVNTKEELIEAINR